MKHYLLSVVYPPGGRQPEPEALKKIMQDVEAVNAEMKAAGAWVLPAGCIRPAPRPWSRSTAARPLTTDGPFAEGKEHIGGLSIVKAPDLDAALGLGRQAFAGDHHADRGLALPGLAWRPPPLEEIERIFRSEYGRAVAILARLDRRPRLGRGGGAGRLRRGARTLARRRAAAEPDRVDRQDGSPPGDRPAAPRGHPRGSPGRSRPACCRSWPAPRKRKKRPPSSTTGCA